MIEYDFHRNKDADKYKAVSLFCGAGGCSLGFSSYGISILGAYDNCPEAIETYNCNIEGHNAHQADLSNCDFNALRNDLHLCKGDLDLIIGGPPCQGFSTLGKRSEDDPRNKLLLNYSKALETFYPRWFMMENVEGMLTTANGSFLIEAIDCMIRLGYTVCVKKVYMQKYGVPQKRKRVLIVGNREGKEFLFPKMCFENEADSSERDVHTLWDAIGDLESKDMPEINHIRKKENGIKLQRIQAIKEGGTMRDLPKELQHDSFAKRAARRVCDGTPTEKRGGAPSGLKRLVYSEPSLTITGSCTGEFIHPRENRMLTIRECARIQTFPDTFWFSGTDSQQEQQIGNAIPPYFANLMAEQIYLSDQKPSSRIPSGLLYYDVSKSDAKSPALATTCKKLDTYLINLFSYE